MATAEKMVRKSVGLPVRTAGQVDALAKAQHTSANQVLRDLIEAGLETRHFSELIERLASTSDPSARKRLKEELARLTFGQ